MRVILNENIDNLGRKGDIVDVAPGYGRNFLIPKKLALEVTPSNMKMIEMKQLALRKKFEQEKSTYQDLIDRLNETRLTFIRKTAEKDVIFGSVSAADIREALSEQGMDVDKKRILLEEPIKRLGNYTVLIKVFHDERAEVKIEVVTEEMERPPEVIKEKDEEEVKEVEKEALPDEEREKADEETVEAGMKPERKEETAEAVIAEPVDKKEEKTRETAETVMMVSEEEQKEEEDKPAESPAEDGKESDIKSENQEEGDKKASDEKEAK